MLLLSVDTSSPEGSLSIVQTKKNSYHCLSHKKWLSNKNQKYSHAEIITVFLQEALREANISLNQLELIICGVGPGSFTGIRVSINFAKSLAFSLNIPLFPISSLESLAEKTRTEIIKTNKQDIKNFKPNEAILSLIHAFSKKIYLVAYNIADFTPLLKKQVINYKELEPLVNLHNIQHWHISGDAYLLFQQYFSDSMKKKFKVYSKITYPDSLSMIELFLQNSAKQKNTVTWENLLPLYIRSSSAEELLNAKK